MLAGILRDRWTTTHLSRSQNTDFTLDISPSLCTGFRLDTSAVEIQHGLGARAVRGSGPSVAWGQMGVRDATATS